jgi:uracil-DNA glycosylase family 4
VLPKPDTCVGCDLHGDGKGFCRNEGSMTNGVLVIGEASGSNEKSDSLPFRPYAQAGSLLERAFKRCGFVRGQFRITNVVRCQPPHDLLSGATYEFAAIQHCRSNLLATLHEAKPRAILALGGTAARELTGYSGTKAGVSYVRGYVLPCIVAGYETVPVVATFHPSFLRQGKPAMFGTLCADIQRAVEVARVGGRWEVT